jgi:excisionase family DNA binding protein
MPLPLFSYPVYYQRQNGYLYFVCDGLNIRIGTELPFQNKENFEKDLIRISKVIGQMELKIQKKQKSFEDSNVKLPKPRKVKQVLTDEKIKKITAPQLAKLMGVSADTVRRRADKGEIPAYLSEKGTRYFLEKDILPFL